MQITAAYQSASLSVANQTFNSTSTAVSKPPQAPSLPDTVEISIDASYQAAALTAQHASLSFDGAISSKNLEETGFSLELQSDRVSFAYESARLQTAPGETSLTSSATAAELRSTSFSFSMSGETPAGGKGAFKLNDEVSAIAKQVKPMVKEFMEASGISGGWGVMNRFLRSVA